MKRTQPLTKSKWTTIIAVSGLCFLSVLTGQWQPCPSEEDEPSVTTEIMKKDVEHCSEADSGYERPNTGPHVFMIGLPF